MSEAAVKQVSQQNLTATKPVKPVEPAPQPTAKVTTPTPTTSTPSSTTAAAAKVKGQKAQPPTGGTYEPPTAEFLRAPDGPGPVVLPVSRFQKVSLHVHLSCM